MMKHKGLEDFLSAHHIGKGETKPVTHTTFGGKYNAKYSIPHESQNEFLKLYYKDVIREDKTHNIIERQMIEKGQGSGPLLVDIDLRFPADLTTRQYTLDHVDTLIQEHLKAMYTIFDMDEDVKFQAYLLEKPAPRVEQKPSGDIVKDGIHMIFNLSFPRVYHQYIRDKVVESLPSIWYDIPISNTNGWEDVLDPCISNGSNGWLLLNSKKRDDQAHYKLTQIYDIHYDTDDNRWCVEKNTEDIHQYIAKNHKFLSPRYIERPTLLTKTEMIPVIKQYEEMKSKPASSQTNSTVVSNQSYEKSEFDALGYRIPTAVIRRITSQEEMEMILSTFLDAVNMDHHQRELRNAYEYAMILPDTYYGEGSYDKWVRVAFALRNTSIYLLIVFIAFSARSKTFSFTTVNDLVDKWHSLPLYVQGGITRDSLMYWAKQESPKEFEQIRENTLDYYVDATLDAQSLESMNKKKGGCKGSTDSDIAEVLFQMMKGEFVSSAYKMNEWYRFKNHRWIKNDCGVELRKIISNQLRDIYRAKASALWEKARLIPDDTEEHTEERNMLKAKADKVLELAMSLGRTKEKDNIMKEAREKFYDEEFVKKIDQNKYLLCCKNGIIDFTNKTFRPGCPEDFITKTTGIDYVPLDESLHKDKMNEIKTFMSQLFPEPELCEYMWDHLSSVLIGDPALNQCLHYYQGIGQNGKSVIVTLMQKILGEYAVDLDIKFFTQERTKIGATSSELFNTIGARYAVAQEPTEGCKLNEGPMKQITSGTDRMSCRPLYGQLVEFLPQVNCVITANNFIEVKSTDWGTWRRIRPVPFKSLFTDKPVQDDPHQPYQFKKVESFDSKFEAWAPIFLSMLVERAFKTNGIVKECSIVKTLRDQYRHREDKVAEYISQKLMQCDGGRIGKTELITSFNDWYHEIYQSRINKNKELFDYMDKNYIAVKNVKDTITGWKGVAIVYNTDGYKNSYQQGDEGGDEDDDDTTISENSRTVPM